MKFFRIAGIVLAVAAVTIVVAEEGRLPEKDDESAKLHKVLDKSLSLYDVSTLRTAAPDVTPKSVHRWTNDERDSHSVGHLTLWVDRGRPVAAMATYLWSDQFYVEFDLLSRETVTVKAGDSVIWDPQSGVEFQPIPNSPVIETSAPARLRQIKALSDQFSATMLGWRADSSDRTELRRLPRELYRYQSEDPQIIDGAVFAFVQGTDPEALLLIEAVKSVDTSHWQFAFIRQTSGALESRHGDRVVWNAPRHPVRTDPSALGLTLSNVPLK